MNLRKFLLASAVLAAASTATWAVPARRAWKTLPLAGGGSVEVTLTGDEWLHCYVDASQQAYTMDGAGLLHKLSQDELGAKARKARARAARQGEARGSQTFRSLKGDFKTLVVLVNFADETFSPTLHPDGPKATYTAMCNADDYTNRDGAIGSVAKYFYDQSYGDFRVSFDVVGPVTVSQGYGYYGHNTSSENDANAAQMVREALALVKDSVDFSRSSPYDWDGDGLAEQVVFVYAGYGEATGGNANTIWPFQYYLRWDAGGMVNFGGISIDNYLVINERVLAEYGTGTFRRTRDVLGGMGTFCHEFSHSLGLMDHYDTLYDRKGYSNYGMGTWDLMDYGSYGGPDSNGWVPVSMTAYERMYLGWLEPAELGDNPVDVTAMRPLKDQRDAYIIYNGAHPDEYFLMENKDMTGWDSYLPTTGLLVTHVDYNRTAWEQNTVNSLSPERVTIVPADGLRNDYSERGDTWPQTGADSLGQDQFGLHNAGPGGRYWLECVVRDIRLGRDGTVAFKYVPPATATSVSAIRHAATPDGRHARYNLAGQRVDGDYRGIVISGGRKFVQK